jgi:hypothetical protein
MHDKPPLNFSHHSEHLRRWKDIRSTRPLSGRTLFSFTPGFSPVTCQLETTNHFNGFPEQPKTYNLTVETVSSDIVHPHPAEPRCESEVKSPSRIGWRENKTLCKPVTADPQNRYATLNSVSAN